MYANLKVQVEGEQEAVSAYEVRALADGRTKIMLDDEHRHAGERIVPAGTAVRVTADF